ncbi:MAG TPA: M28 family peptidase, partial [Anaerolineae bacterium]|nr:M28 family peptidase [Anaerolineae bacterium]
MTEIITDFDAQYAYDIVKAICTEVGPGLPGSSQERARAAMIEKELASHLGAGNVAVEEFTFAPSAFLRSSSIIALFTLIAALLNISMGRLTGASSWLAAIAALALSIISPLLYIFEGFFGFELLDPLFKKKQSINVVGTLRKPGTKDVRRLLLLSGHHDSASENTWLRFLGYGFYFLAGTWFLGFITMLVMSTIQLAGLIAGNADIVRFGTLGWVLLVYPIAPSILFALFLSRGWKNGGIVPGAADNLSGSALTVAMCRFLVKNPAYIPDDTEIRFVSFGSEEAGCRGSRRYVARHLDELKRLDARLLNYETIAHPEPFILTSETNGTVKNSPEMVNGVVAAAERAGVPYKVQSATLGTGSDAGPFSRAGLKATTLIGFRIPQMVRFYHQKWDTPEVL